MSMENVSLFYRYLEKTPDVQREALDLQKKYPEQEQVIDAFIALAEREGFPFTFEEFMQMMYRQAKTEDSSRS